MLAKVAMQFKSMFHGMSYAQMNQQMCTFTASNGLQIGSGSTKLFKIKVGAGTAEHPVVATLLITSRLGPSIKDINKKFGIMDPGPPPCSASVADLWY